MASLGFPSAETIFVALLGGILPAVLWLWFWRKEDSDKPEPRGMVFLLFAVGMVAVILAIPLQKYAYGRITNQTELLAVWATIEEILKFLVFFAISAKSRFLDEPIDYAVNMITVALGFSALENTLFLIDPIENSGAIAGLLTGNLRFIGATVLHSVASAFIGISLGLAFYSGKFVRFLAMIAGILTAVLLHTAFNFFIITYKEEHIFVVFGFLWVVAVIVMLLFEKLKNLKAD